MEVVRDIGIFREINWILPDIDRHKNSTEYEVKGLLLIPPINRQLKINFTQLKHLYKFWIVDLLFWWILVSNNENHVAYTSGAYKIRYSLSKNIEKRKRRMGLCPYYFKIRINENFLLHSEQFESIPLSYNILEIAFHKVVLWRTW